MADRLPIAEIVHAMPGRARLRIVERRGDAVFFASVATGLSTIAGVHKVEVRPLTGSILLQHGPPLERISAAAREARLFTVEDVGDLLTTTPAMVIDPKVVVGLGLGGLAVWRLADGHILPPAITLAWYAANLMGLLSNGNFAEDDE
jgi:hypothetical protein